jgi:hypothetical protein
MGRDAPPDTPGIVEAAIRAAGGCGEGLTMNGIRCQHENPAGVKFCGECGARLEAVCPACQAANPPANKFCHQCGGSLTGEPNTLKSPSPDSYTPKHLAEKILTSKAALEGERKQVTVRPHVGS